MLFLLPEFKNINLFQLCIVAYEYICKVISPENLRGGKYIRIFLAELDQAYTTVCEKLKV